MSKKQERVEHLLDIHRVLAEASCIVDTDSLCFRISHAERDRILATIKHLLTIDEPTRSSWS